jgi:hypothetical protein
VVLFFISVTLESGMYFMHSHKQVLRILETQMRLTFSGFVPLLWKVPAKSSTTSIIRAALYLLLATWIIYCLWQASLTIFAKAAHGSGGFMVHLPSAIV